MLLDNEHKQRNKEAQARWKAAHPKLAKSRNNIYSKQWHKLHGKDSRINLTDRYIKARLKIFLDVALHEITQEMIDLKRAQLKLIHHVKSSKLQALRERFKED